MLIVSMCIAALFYNFCILTVHLQSFNRFKNSFFGNADDYFQFFALSVL